MCGLIPCYFWRWVITNPAEALAFIFAFGFIAALLVIYVVQSWKPLPRPGEFGSGVLPRRFERDAAAAADRGPGIDPRTPASPRPTALAERSTSPRHGSAYGHPSPSSFSRPVDRSSSDLTSPAIHPQAGEANEE